jgi:hypothetical protein
MAAKESAEGVHCHTVMRVKPADNADRLNTLNPAAPGPVMNPPRLLVAGIIRFADVVTKVLERPLIVPKSLNV